MKKLSISDLLKNNFEKYVATFEMSETLKGFLDIDEINAIIHWYNQWKLTTPIEKQTTCTIKDIFGTDAIKVIVSINFWKYLRNKDYDPEIIEKIIS
jgi:hypothetical protein